MLGLGLGLSSTSGAMYSGVPTTLYSRPLSVCSSLDKPKSDRQMCPGKAGQTLPEAAHSAAAIWPAVTVGDLPSRGRDMPNPNPNANPNPNPNLPSRGRDMGTSTCMRRAHEACPAGCTVGCDQDILGLEVAIHDAVLVQVSLAHVHAQLLPTCYRRALLLEDGTRVCDRHSMWRAWACGCAGAPGRGPAQLPPRGCDPLPG